MEVGYAASRQQSGGPLPSRVLVTGASGFIGRHVCQALVEQGCAVTALLRSPSRTPLDGCHTAIATGLDDRTALRQALHGVDAVVHLAARVHVMREESDDPRAEYWRTNVDGTRVLVEEAVASGVGRLVFMSSVKAVGEANSSPWNRDTRPSPIDPYGESKLAAELLVREAADRSDMSAVILRLPLTYGPGNRANMLRLFELVDRGMPLPLGGIRNCRSLAYVGNVAAAVGIALATADPALQPFFVSDGQDVSTPDLVRAIGRALDRPVRLLPVPAAVFRAGGWLGDRLSPVVPVPLTSAAVHRLLGSLTVDSTPLWALAGGAPPFSLQQGLEETAHWFRSRHAD